MGKKCCVPCCNSNYNSTNVYVSTFKFPKDESRRQLWIRKINRADFNPSPTAVVCIKHFSEQFIIREDRAVRDDGSVLIVPRKIPKLTDDAYPSIFDNQPSYMSSEPPPKRRNPSERQEELKQREEQKFLKWCTEDVIPSFEYFKNSYKSKINNEWTFRDEKEFILFYKLDCREAPKVIVSFKVKQDLTIAVWHGQQQLNVKQFEFILQKEKCDRWTKLDCLFHLLDNYKENEICRSDKLKHALQILLDYQNEIEAEEGKNLYYLDIIVEHISLILCQKYTYTPHYLLFASKLFYNYSSAYNFIRNSKILILPHPVYLKRLASPLNNDSKLNNSKHISYLMEKTKLLDSHTKIVSLLLDEIYVNPSVSYKSGKIVGVADNCVNEATTIQAFMITSLFSKNTDIIALIPVKNQTADILLSHTLKVLKILNDLSSTVLCLISDNNRINRNMFTKMCGGSLKFSIQNPADPDKKLFFLFDSVHLIKSVRNNWLKQKTEDQTLYFPNPDDFSKILKASIQPLINIYESEKDKILKAAPKLSQKVLYPTSIEKQNVLHALNMFHETNIAALSTINNEMNVNSGTITFLDTFLKWWKIMNVKHPNKGIRFNDEFCIPILNVNDKNVQFLIKFKDWLSSWENFRNLEASKKKSLGFPGKGGFLTKETHFALSFTNSCIIDLINHVFVNYHPKYLLLGKFQTDPLEARFGQYRQMSGGNYHISCQQIYESENKLKILNYIELYSDSKGLFPLKSIELSNSEDFKGETDIPEILYETLNSYEFEITSEQNAVFIFISGYVGKQVCNKLNCQQCQQCLLLNKNLEFESNVDKVVEYLSIINRGNLRWPTEFVIKIVVETYLIFLKLISKQYESVFLNCKNHKLALEQLAFEKFELICTIPDIHCICDSNMKILTKQCLSVCSNILINNYVKARNDNINIKNAKRKLSTFNK